MITHVPYELPMWLKRLFSRRKEARQEDKLIWIPETDIERRIYAALILAGRPVTNGELAELMRCSKSHASKQVAALNGQVQKLRIGRQVRIGLPHQMH